MLVSLLSIATRPVLRWLLLLSYTCHLLFLCAFYLVRTFVFCGIISNYVTHVLNLSKVICGVCSVGTGYVVL